MHRLNGAAPGAHDGGGSGGGQDERRLSMTLNNNNGPTTAKQKQRLMTAATPRQSSSSRRASVSGGGASSATLLQDLVAIFVWRHATSNRSSNNNSFEVLLRRVEGRGWWLPFLPLIVSTDDDSEDDDDGSTNSHDSEKENRLIEQLARQIGVTGQPSRVRQIRHFEGTKSRKTVAIIYDFELVSASSSIGGSNDDECRWMTIEQMRQLETSSQDDDDDDDLANVLLDRWPLTFVEQSANKAPTGSILQVIRAPSNCDELLTAHHRRSSAKKNDNREKFDWLGSKPAKLVNLNAKALETVFADFMARTWPGTEMTFGEFRRQIFPTNKGQEADDLWRVFRLASTARNGRLSFFDYVNAMAMVVREDIATMPELVDAKLRMLFAYFASQDRKRLQKAELDALITKLLLGSQSATQQQQQQPTVLMINGDGHVTFDEFERIMRQNYLGACQGFTFNATPGSNVVLGPLSSSSPSATDRHSSSPVRSAMIHFEEVKQISLKSKFFRNNRTTTAQERAKFLEILAAVSKEANNNPIITVNDQQNQQEAPSSSLAPTSVPATVQFVLNSQIVTLRRTSHQLSLEQSPVDSTIVSASNNGSPVTVAQHYRGQLAREMLNLLNDFLVEERCVSSNSAKAAASVSLYAFIFKWKTQSAQVQFLETFTRLVEAAMPLFQAERRLLAIDSPCYVAGDLHGNYHDLQTMSSLLWRHGPSLCLGKLLFLGDYVDRGPNALEVLANLLAQKLLAPDRVFLVRGNHDDPQVNLDFLSSCGEFFIGAYGDYDPEASRNLWLQVNRMFASLPLAALVDGAIFCSHSGIVSRKTLASLDEINSIPNRLESVYDNETAIELCWNDPILPEHAQLQEVQADLNERKDGFAVNTQRSPMQQRDRRILYFTKDAFRYFMATHRLQYFVRAQESFRRGCVDLESKVLTVSCSEPAFNATVLQIDRAGRLQLLRIHTQLMIRDLKMDANTLFEPTNQQKSSSFGKFDNYGIKHRNGGGGNKVGTSLYLPPLLPVDDYQQQQLIRADNPNSKQRRATKNPNGYAKHN